jgi:protein phosphatase
VRRAVLEADRTIAACIARVTTAPGAATVVLAAPLDPVGGRWLLAWVGDCRAYRLARGRTGVRAARLDLLTRDDTFRHLHEPVPPGGSPDDPARMVGNGATGGPNVAVHDLGPGELLALCSDGVHKRLGAGDWRRVLLQRLTLVERCEDAIRVARANGSADDATVLLIERPAPIGLPADGSTASSESRFARAVRQLCSGQPARRPDGTPAPPVGPTTEGDER